MLVASQVDTFSQSYYQCQIIKIPSWWNKSSTRAPLLPQKIYLENRTTLLNLEYTTVFREKSHCYLTCCITSISLNRSSWLVHLRPTDILDTKQLFWILMETLVSGRKSGDIWHYTWLVSQWSIKVNSEHLRPTDILRTV